MAACLRISGPGRPSHIDPDVYSGPLFCPAPSDPVNTWLPGWRRGRSQPSSCKRRMYAAPDSPDLRPGAPLCQRRSRAERSPASPLHTGRQGAIRARCFLKRGPQCVRQPGCSTRTAAGRRTRAIGTLRALTMRPPEEQVPRHARRPVRPYSESRRARAGPARCPHLAWPAPLRPAR